MSAEFGMKFLLISLSTECGESNAHVKPGSSFRSVGHLFASPSMKQVNEQTAIGPSDHFLVLKKLWQEVPLARTKTVHGMKGNGGGGGPK